VRATLEVVVVVGGGAMMRVKVMVLDWPLPSRGKRLGLHHMAIIIKVPIPVPTPTGKTKTRRRRICE